MIPDLVPHESAVRLAAFIACFSVLALVEVWWPRRDAADRRHRWPLNLGLSALNTVVVRVAVPASGLTFAFWAARHRVGLFARLDGPPALEMVAAVVALDALVYLQHRLFHAVPILWRVHRLHHADRSVDVTTGVRFHPVEMIVSTVYKGVAVLLLGASPGAVLAFELSLNLGALFSHANIRLGGDRWWRALLVTPDMHRTHHSTDAREQRRNFGFCLSWWDRLCGTYQAAPRLPTTTMPLGLADPAADRAMLGR